MTDTIAIMRKRVLDMAIRGELVEHREEEGTAEELYQDIQSIKETLIKSGKIKKEKKLPEIELEVVPFDIPRSWKWVRLGEVSTLLNGDRGKNYPGKAYWTDEGIPFINAGTLNNKYLDSRNMNFIPEERYKLLRSGFVEKNDIIYCLRGSLGKISINNKYERGAIASSVVIIRTNENIDVEYLYYLLVSNYAEKLIQKVNTGTAQPNISARNVSEYEIPLPPLQEQKRIVTKIEEIFAVIDQIGTRKEDSLTIIENIRQSSLQNAIMGQLVEQNENDEPAIELIKKIQLEKEQLIKEKKLKKENALSEIIKEDIPYAIPINWEWVRLGEVTTIKGGKRVPKGNKFSEEITKHVYLRVTDMRNQSIETGSLKYLTDEVYEKIKSYTISKDELYLTIAGTIGRVGLIPEELDNMSLTENACKIYPYNNDKKLLMYFLMSPFIQNQFQEGYNQSAQPKLSIRTTSNTIIPLPPLVEQKRIVEKLDQIMAICDQMESLLNGFYPTDVALKVAE